MLSARERDLLAFLGRSNEHCLSNSAEFCPEFVTIGDLHIRRGVVHHAHLNRGDIRHETKRTILGQVRVIAVLAGQLKVR